MPKRGRNAILKRFGGRLGRWSVAGLRSCTMRGPRPPILKRSSSSWPLWPRLRRSRDWKNVVKNSGTTVKNKTKKIARSSISYTINLFFAVFWGCHCIWASASVRGHPREKHLVYVVGAGSRATHCKNAAANGLPLAEKTAKSHSKCHAIGFFGAVSSRSSHRSVGHRLPCGRRRSETTWWTSGPQDVGLCVVRVCGENAHRANRWQTAARNLGEKERALFNARDRFA